MTVWNKSSGVNTDWSKPSGISSVAETFELTQETGDNLLLETGDNILAEFWSGFKKIAGIINTIWQ